MKKNNARFRRHIAVFTLLFTAVAAIYSCKKDGAQGNPKDLVSQLKASFNNQKVKGISLEEKFSSVGLRPEWSSAIIKKNRKDKPLIVIPLQDQVGSYVEMNIVLSKGSENTIVKKYTLNSDNTIALEIFRPSGELIMTGKYHSTYKKFTPNHITAKNISLFSPDNNVGNKIPENSSILLSKRFSTLKINTLMTVKGVISSNGGTGGTDDPEDECPPGVICLDDVTISAPGPKEPDIPGIDIPNLPPLDPIDYFPTEPTIPVGNDNGGDNTQNTPLIDIRKDSIKAKFPCAKSLILDSLERIGEYNKMVKPFMVNGTKPDITWNTTAQPWSGTNYSGGTTKISSDSFTGMSSDINLNSAMLQNASKLLIAAVSIHETYHAYINYLFASEGNVSLVNESKPNYMAGLYQYIIYEQTGASDNYTDHYNMLTSQFDNFTKILFKFGGGSFTMDECRKATLFGMDNPGPNPQPNQTAFINQAYNALLTKYGYTASDLNTFFTQQVNAPASKKLPASGCN